METDEERVRDFQEKTLPKGQGGQRLGRPNGPFQQSGISIVWYADDFILMAKKLKPQAIEYLKGMLARMKVTLNEEKTRLVDATRLVSLGCETKRQSKQYAQIEQLRPVKHGT